MSFEFIEYADFYSWETLDTVEILLASIIDLYSLDGGIYLEEDESLLSRVPVALVPGAAQPVLSSDLFYWEKPRLLFIRFSMPSLDFLLLSMLD
jgi:hypothetical protein